MCLNGKLEPDRRPDGVGPSLANRTHKPACVHLGVGWGHMISVWWSRRYERNRIREQVGEAGTEQTTQAESEALDEQRLGRNPPSALRVFLLRQS